MGLKETWRDGGTGIGLWCVISDPAVLEIAARAGFDYVTVDMQHGLNNWGTVNHSLRVLSTTGTTVLVRVPANREEYITRALDLCAAGVVVPMINTAKYAVAAVTACRYPAKVEGRPLGNRSFGPIWADLDDLPDTDVANDNAICVVQIETATAVENVEQIVRTPGLDAVYIGPYDLALGIGLGGQTYRESYVIRDTIQKVIDAANAAGIVAAMHCDGPEMAAYWHAHGARMLTSGLDSTVVNTAYRNLANDVRKEAKID